MQLRYVIKGVSIDRVETIIDEDNSTVKKMLVVEAVSEDGLMGHTFKFPYNADAANLYTVDTVIVATFDVDSGE